MPAPDSGETLAATQRSPAQFPTTHWSLIVAAAESNHGEAQRALTDLCARYWYPIYCYVRRHARSVEDAEDLTQSFFAQILEGRILRAADPDRGRFRSFLLGCLRHHMSHERDRAQALKRGGGAPVLSLDWSDAEQRYCLEPPDPMTPERLFERRWALDLLARTLESLRQEMAAAGKQTLCERIEPFLTREGPTDPQAKIATELGMSVNALRIAIHRMRGRFRELLRDEIAQTVRDPSEVEGEIEHLCCIFGPNA